MEFLIWQGLVVCTLLHEMGAVVWQKQSFLVDSNDLRQAAVHEKGDEAKNASGGGLQGETEPCIVAHGHEQGVEQHRLEDSRQQQEVHDRHQGLLQVMTRPQPDESSSGNVLDLRGNNAN